MLCTVFDFGNHIIDICLFVLYCIIRFVCVLCVFFWQVSCPTVV